MTGFGWLHPPAVTATHIAVKMMTECTFTVHAECGVRIIPLIGGMLFLLGMRRYVPPLLTIDAENMSMSDMDVEGQPSNERTRFWLPTVSGISSGIDC